MAEQQKPKLGYWNIRGLAHPIRLLLHYTETEYEEVLYVHGPDWFDIKFSLGLEFPNLPYLIAGDLKITESSAIIHYIADKNDLLGKDAETRARVKMMEDIIVTWRGQNAKAAYNANFAELRAQLLENVEKYIQKFLSILATRPFLAGDYITYVDFMLYEYAVVALAMEPSFRDKYPKLVEFIERIEALPAVKKYMESKEFIKYPFNARHAAWGGKGEAP